MVVVVSATAAAADKEEDGDYCNCFSTMMMVTVIPTAVCLLVAHTSSPVLGLEEREKHGDGDDAVVVARRDGVLLHTKCSGAT